MESSRRAAIVVSGDVEAADTARQEAPANTALVTLVLSTLGSVETQESSEWPPPRSGHTQQPRFCCLNICDTTRDYALS